MKKQKCVYRQISTNDC